MLAMPFRQDALSAYACDAAIPVSMELNGAHDEKFEVTIELAEGVTLFTQHCHTAGLLGLCVRLVDRTVIFTGDTVYTRESYEQELPPGGSINKTDSEFRDNIAMLKAMQKAYDAEMFFGHDYAQACAWEKKGWIE